MSVLHRVATSFAFLLATTCVAQTVYVVDGLNRPGTHFTDLPPAEAAAVDGDTILLRSDGGFYHAVATHKALTIAGDSPGRAEIAGAGPGFTISGLPAGREFVLQNVELNSFGGAAPRLVVQGCAGRVHLVRVLVHDYAGNAGLDVSLCRAVTARDSEFQGRPGLIAQNATIAISVTRCLGQGGASATLLPASGVVLLDTSAWFADVQASGGNAWHTNAPAPAIELLNANLSMTGVPNGARAQAGFLGTQASPGFTAAVPAIHGQNSLLRIDPEVTLGPTGGAAAIVGVTATTTPIPSFSMVGVPLLQVLSDAGAATAQVTIVGLPGDPLAVPGVEGRLWLDPNQMLVLGGVLGGFGGFYESLLPPGLTLAIQVVSLQSNAYELSTPAIVHSRP
ncbi:MAG TPA: hypothetical protein VFZ65_04455 [Planctomycetota bacterium]|nr:hypothetical protein [Planctomycetota bacterium]